MTLGIGIVTQEYAYLVSDRRTTRAGFATSDEFDKTCLLMTRDARVAIGFTGLAEVRRYNSKVRLIENIVASAPPDYVLVETIKRMTHVLNHEFLSHRDIRQIDERDRRFTLLFVGFRRQWNIDFPTFGLISNFQDLETEERADVAWPEFRPFLTDLPPNIPSHGLAIGFTEALDGVATLQLVKDAPNLSPRATVAKLARLVHRASTNKANIIGGQVTSFVIPRSYGTTALTDYHVLTPQRSIYSPAQVNATQSPIGLISVASFAHEDPNGPILRTPLVGRNKSCPCGSKRKYKTCHSPKAMIPIQFHMVADGRNGNLGGQLKISFDEQVLRRENMRLKREFRKTQRQLKEERKIARALALRIEELRATPVDHCPLCNNTGWVCDQHAHRPWKGNYACNCGASGAPCRACNYPRAGKMPRFLTQADLDNQPKLEPPA
jgi:hypothetical protein